MSEMNNITNTTTIKNGIAIVNNQTSIAELHKDTIANSIDYYIYDIAIMGIIYIGLMMINKMNSKANVSSKTEVQNKAGIEKEKLIKIEGMTPEQKKLRRYYLIGSLLIKAATWVKAPYLFALYNRLHGFTRQEIGILYAVDNLSSLIFGPLIGGLSDTFGNKNFCVCYGLFVSSHIYLRLTGSKFLAYFAQIITGICSCILDVSFETWFVNESALLFTNEQKFEKESFRSEVFAKQVQIDCLTSIFLTALATILYMHYGITLPFIACSIFSLIASSFVFIFWKESSKEQFQMHENKFSSRKINSSEEE